MQNIWLERARKKSLQDITECQQDLALLVLDHVNKFKGAAIDLVEVGEMKVEELVGDLVEFRFNVRVRMNTND